LPARCKRCCAKIRIDRDGRVIAINPFALDLLGYVEFLSSMSHELRTPLNAILGFAQPLANGRRQPLSDKQARQGRQIEKSGQHLLSLINEVLDLAKIESGHMPLSLETITHAIEDACQTLEPSAEASGIHLACTPPPAAWQIRADYTRVKQVLFNLISNAIKYNSSAGSIQVTAEPHADALCISVADTGPGIAQHRRHELFEPFNRLDAENSAVEGTGIGLAITRELIVLTARPCAWPASFNSRRLFTWKTTPPTSG